MYSRLTNAKLFGSLSHSCIRINNKIGYFYGPLFDISLQEMALPLNIVRKIYEGMFKVRTKLMYNVRKDYFVRGNVMLINGTRVK